MNRALAAVAAVLMIVAAIVVRGALDDRTEQNKAPIRIVCATELELVCTRLSETDEKTVVRVEPVGTTADGLAKLADDAVAPLDAWIVPSPWPQAVEERRQRAGLSPLLETAAAPVARSPLTAVVFADRARALSAHCDGELTWTCIGEAAPQQWADVGGQSRWGRVKVGHDLPDDAGIGAAVLGQLAAGWFGRTDLATQDLDDDAFSDWFNGLERSRRGASGALSALAGMLAQGPSFLDVAIVTEADATRVLAASPARRAQVRVLYLDPVTTADVHVARVRNGAERARTAALVTDERVRAALAELSWRTGSGGAPTTPAGPAGPAGTATPGRAGSTTSGGAAKLSPPGRPSPGFLQALVNRWKVVR